MPGALLLDTAGWFAALSPREHGHETARDTYADAVRGGELIVTTPLVAAEMHTLILRWRGPSAGTLFLETVFETGSHFVVPLDTELIEAAISRWIRRFADKSLSLADAVSFEVMRRERITRALTFDRHFADANFEILKPIARK
ncbi:MAG: PIN domain-containing protein [Gemmatimonadota bacterium]|nr:PIN domain-containing protein [Gemmatimonadota bacterium]